MSINKETYQLGIQGLLSEEEINSLPRDYEMHKGSFLEATNGIKIIYEDGGGNS